MEIDFSIPPVLYSFADILLTEAVVLEVKTLQVASSATRRRGGKGKI
ncbi:MAG: hypothetical protein G01um101417_383 [Parcubacteria group bacterium Gr01-1014_17]|nr:MAG: hypothetical protein G01um101417_383 [Parcubacteria group bacterium Gr01-1014_17]